MAAPKIDYRLKLKVCDRIVKRCATFCLKNVRPKKSSSKSWALLMICEHKCTYTHAHIDVSLETGSMLLSLLLRLVAALAQQGCAYSCAHVLCECVQWVDWKLHLFRCGIIVCVLCATTLQCEPSLIELLTVPKSWNKNDFRLIVHAYTQNSSLINREAWTMDFLYEMQMEILFIQKLIELHIDTRWQTKLICIGCVSSLNGNNKRKNYTTAEHSRMDMAMNGVCFVVLFIWFSHYFSCRFVATRDSVVLGRFLIYNSIR